MIEHPAYPVDGWHIRETEFAPDVIAQGETIFATANGYLGMRGNLEEADPVFERGTYLNGFYESRPYVYPESAYGFAHDAQTMLNVTDGKILRLKVDGEPLDVTTGTLIEHDRVLDLRRGFAGREVVWESPGGRRVSLRTRRLVSFVYRNVACIEYEVMPLDRAATLEISSELVANESDRTASDDPREVSEYWGQVLRNVWSHAEGTRLGFGHDTQRSQLAVFCAADHTVNTNNSWSSEVSHSDGSRAAVTFTVDAQPGEPFRVVKHLVYVDGRSDQADELAEKILTLLDEAVAIDVRELLAEQMTFLDRFWSDCHVEVTGDDAMQQAVRFALFQMLQAAACAQGTGIPAKGLTGQGYAGHYFWDMEAYVLAAMSYLAPEHTSRALEFRHSTLDSARQRARELSKAGAMFPWRTINGSEASAFFPAGTAEYHIGADIAEAVQHYLDLSGDEQFLVDHGAEILIETARMWSSLGYFDPSRDGSFCIRGVTGPDEYTAIVDNNTFTNLMAKANLANAAAAVDRLRSGHAAAFKRLANRLGLADEEVETWRAAAEKMYVHYDDELGVHGQDDSFLDLEPWDVPVDQIPAEQRPLLLHYHPLDLYRRRIIKQADLVMAMFVRGEEFTDEQKARNFAYYEPLTTADSSLSKCIQAIVAAEVGDVEKAWQYTRESALTDLQDVQHNVRDGIHIASQAGTWLALACGFGGLRRREGGLSFNPCLPEDLTSLMLRLRYRASMLEVTIESDVVTYALHWGDEITIWHRGEQFTVGSDGPLRLS